MDAHPPKPESPRHRLALPAVGVALLAAAFGGAVQALSESRRFADFASDQWTVVDGLPQVAVQTLGQDGDGYLWVGTQAGIARFDGVRFEAFDRERTGLDTSMPESAYRARDGRVWFATRIGALSMRGDRVRQYASAGTPVPVHAITEWPDGRMLFGTPIGLHALQDGVLVPAGLEGTDVSALLEAGTVLWVGTRGRLLRREGGSTRSIALPGAPQARITRLMATGGTLWIGSTAGLWRMVGDGVPERFAPEPELASEPIKALCADSGGSLWFSTTPRLFRYHSSGRIERITDEEFIRNPWINDCFEDREGNLWLGSHTESLFRLWDGLLSRLGEADGLSNPFVWSLESDGAGGVLIGTNSGLDRYSAGRVTPLVPASALPDPAVYELARRRDGRIWIGTRAGLREWRDGRLDMPPGGARLEGLQVNGIEVEATATWIGSSGGLFRAAGDGPLEPVAEGALDGSLAKVRSVLPLGPARALIGTEAGVRRVDGDQVAIPEWAAPLEGRMITDLLRLDDGRVVIATLDSGLWLVGGDRAVRLVLPGQSPTLILWALRVDGHWLYATSSEGLLRVSLADLPDPRVASADAALPAQWIVSMTGRNQSGQRARCCNGGGRSRLLMVDGRMWLPSISGILRVDLESVGLRGAEPLVRVENAWHVDRLHVPGEAPLRIEDGQRDLRIDYTALHFRNPRAMGFQYRLEGYDDDWVEAGARRSAYYTNLPPGEYRFRVRADDGSGQKVMAGNSLDLVVVPHWHERLETRIAALVGAVGLAVLAVLLAVRRQKRRTRALEALVAERTTQLQRANERLQQANAALSVESQTDALTGLPNRRALFQQMPAMLARHPEGVVMALVDLDHFKRINDEFGHAAGDVVLREFANFLRRTTREGDLLARWGGEEFLVVFAGLPDHAAPARVAALLDAGRALHFDLGGRTVYPGFSVGWTRHPLGATAQADWAHALEIADVALYEAKSRGRGTWVGISAGPSLGALTLGPECGSQVPSLLASKRLQRVLPEPPAR